MRMPEYPYTTPPSQPYCQQTPWRPQSILEQQTIQQKILKAIMDEKHKLFVKNLNPFNVCPTSFTVFFSVFKNHTTIGVSFLSLRNISIAIRQAIEPHGCVASNIRIIELRTPFPLVLVAMFSAVGLFISGTVNKIIEESKEKITKHYEEGLSDLEEKLNIYIPGASQDSNENITETLIEENHKTILKEINPFNVCPTGITVYYPVYKNHTTIGISFSDLEKISIVIRQALEPHDCIYSLIRIIELRVPFPLNLLALFLSLGIFFSGVVEKAEQETREDIIGTVKENIQQIKNN